MDRLQKLRPEQLQQRADVLASVACGSTYEETSNRYSVNERTVVRWVQQFKLGTLMPPGPLLDTVKAAFAAEQHALARASILSSWVRLVLLANKKRKQKRAEGSRRGSLTIGSETLTVREWSSRTGVSGGLIVKRLQRGWSVRDAVMTSPASRVGPRSPAEKTERSERAMRKNANIAEQLRRRTSLRRSRIEEAEANSLVEEMLPLLSPEERAFVDRVLAERNPNVRLPSPARRRRR